MRGTMWRQPGVALALSSATVLLAVTYGCMFSRESPWWAIYLVGFFGFGLVTGLWRMSRRHESRMAPDPIRRDRWDSEAPDRSQ